MGYSYQLSSSLQYRILYHMPESSIYLADVY